MKKYLVFPAIVFIVACNSNEDQKSTASPEAETSKLSKEDTTSGSGILSGNFEIVDYKKDNVKVTLPKTIVQFTRKGDFIKSDGNAFFYKIEGDSISMLLNDNYVINKSGIEFLNADKTAFTIKNSNEKTEYTYQKVKQ